MLLGALLLSLLPLGMPPLATTVLAQRVAPLSEAEWSKLGQMFGLHGISRAGRQKLAAQAQSAAAFARSIYPYRATSRQAACPSMTACPKGLSLVAGLSEMQELRCQRWVG